MGKLNHGVLISAHPRLVSACLASIQASLSRMTTLLLLCDTQARPVANQLQALVPAQSVYNARYNPLHTRRNLLIVGGTDKTVSLVRQLHIGPVTALKVQGRSSRTERGKNLYTRVDGPCIKATNLLDRRRFSSCLFVEGWPNARIASKRFA